MPSRLREVTHSDSKRERTPGRLLCAPFMFGSARHSSRIRPLGDTETTSGLDSRAVRFVLPTSELTGGNMHAVIQDLTLSFRLLRRQRAFTLGVALTLAVGIGANASMITLLDATFL